MYNLEQIKKSFSILCNWYSSYYHYFKKLVDFVWDTALTSLFKNNNLKNCLYVKMSFLDGSVLSKKKWTKAMRWVKYYAYYYFEFYDNNDVLLDKIRITEQQFDKIQFRVMSIKEKSPTFKYF